MSRFTAMALWGLLAGPTLALGGCDGESAEAVDAAAPDAGPPAPACVEDPTTHLEIINACTTATPVHKTPVTPLLREDGTLPPLP